MNFLPLTPLEHLSLTHREGIQAAMLCWLLGEDSPLPLRSRLRILNTFDGVDYSAAPSTYARTEVNDIDLLVHAGRHAVAFEVKLKSREHSNQLDAYDRILNQFPTCSKFLLTLTGEQPRSGTGWRPLTYADVLAAVRPECQHARSHHDYLQDYLTTLERVVAAAELVCTRLDYAAAVFWHASDEPSSADFVEWMEGMRFQVPLQWVWLRKVGEAALDLLPESSRHHWGIHIDETRAEGLLDIYRDIAAGPGAHYRIGIQVQKQAVKVFCHPQPYPAAASAAQHKHVEDILEALRAPLGLRSNHRITTSKSRGFRSFVVERNADMPLDTAAWSPLIAERVQALHRAIS